MIEIPEYFLQKASRQFGQRGPGWVKALPTIFEQCLEKWKLTECKPIENLSINLVYFAKSPVYGDVVLKIQGPHSERYTEMAALDLFAGRFACRCLENDRDLAAMLLERVMPGKDLRIIASKDEQLAIGTEMICQLPIPIQEDYIFPSYRLWMDNAFTKIFREYHPDDQLKQMMNYACDLYELIKSSEKYLLHGDLHHENILRSGVSHWKIIDPQGVIGSPIFECGRFIENHVIYEAGLDENEAAATISYIAYAMKKPLKHVAAAFFILHLLSYCWGFEMAYPPEELNYGFGECAELMRFVKTF